MLKSKLTPSKTVEYSVYVHYPPETCALGECCWEKTKTTSNVYRALKKAERLYKSHKYQKVEIKKKSVDYKNNVTGSILKTYESKNWTLPLYFFLLAALMISAALFALYILLS